MAVAPPKFYDQTVFSTQAHENKAYGYEPDSWTTNPDRKLVVNHYYCQNCHIGAPRNYLMATRYLGLYETGHAQVMSLLMHHLRLREQYYDVETGLRTTGIVML